MKTPINDFINNYINSSPTRFHMPGHKGEDLLDFYKYDITEIIGADDLYSANGIILESENNATKIFNTRHTFYVTGGSSQSIKSMVHLAKLFSKNKSNTILAARNAHKSLLHSASLLQIDIDWIYPNEDSDVSSICSCNIKSEELDNKLKSYKQKPMAVFITSPDYLGGINDIKSLSAVCKKHGVLLLVDNAHGAYLKFLKEDIHPITLGADLVCDSAHKTLPVLTGGAYLHISKNALFLFEEYARTSLSYFGTSSPSYLILQSLDKINPILNSSFKNDLEKTILKINQTKDFLISKGVFISNSDPLRIVIDCLKSGYLPNEINNILLKSNIHCEYIDNRYIVLMITVSNKDKDFSILKSAFNNFIKKDSLKKENIKFIKGTQKLSFNQTLFSLSKKVSVDEAENEICASSVISCPPAIPIVVSGEIITKDMILLLKKYSITHINIISK